MKTPKVIVVVVASPDLKQAIADALRAAGFIVLEATRGEDAAWGCASGLHPDGFFIDLGRDAETQQFAFECHRNRRDALVVAAGQSLELDRSAVRLHRSNPARVAQAFESWLQSNVYRFPTPLKASAPDREGA